MRKYFWLTISIVSVGLLIFLSITIVIFSQGLKKLNTILENRMMAAAAHCTEYINITIQKNKDVLPVEEINSWLEQYCLSTGFDRIVLCDSSGIVIWSSNELFIHGDNFEDFLIEQALFNKTVTLQNYNFTLPMKIEGVLFKSLYYSSFISGEYYVVIVEADQNYFDDAVGFRNSIILNSGILVIVCFILLVSIYIIDRQSQKALALASHNERLAFLGRTSAELAHELKNPLAIIKSSIDVLRNTYDEKRNNKAFTFISDEIMRLSNMITNILNFSKNSISNKEQFYPKVTIDTLIKTISDMYPKIVIHNNIYESLKLIGDSQLFHQIADNIIRNSVSAMKETGQINIISRQNKNKYILIFTDTGPGIPNQLKKKIFDPFVTQSKTGTGLGLAIVKSICKILDWDIDLISNSRGKTAFAITIKESLWVKS